MARPIPILMYHNIARAPRGAKLRGLYVSPGRFARQMQLLRRLGYQGLSLTQALPWLRGERDGKVAVITFDDGYVDNLEHALPVLQAVGFGATCYVVSGQIGQYNAWDAEALGVRKPLMDAVALRAWQEEGMEIGAHTRSHPHLPQLLAEELEAEIRGSREDLEDLLGSPVEQFCYPYGEAGEREIAVAQAAGFVSAVSTRRGRARPGEPLWSLPRVSVGGHHAPHVFPLQLLTRHEDRH